MTFIARMFSFCLVVALIGSEAPGQVRGRKLLDSMLAELPHHHGDSMEVRLFHAIGYQYFTANTDSGIFYGRKTVELATAMKWRKGEAAGYSVLGTNFLKKSEYPAALDYLYKALTAYDEAGAKNGVAFTLGNIGVVYQYQGKFDKAIESVTRSVKMYEELGEEKNVAAQTEELGIVYWTKKSYDTALSYHLRAQAIFEKIGDKGEVARSYLNTALVYDEKHEYDKAIIADRKALAVFKGFDDKLDIGVCFTNLGDLYAKVAKDPDRARYKEVVSGSDQSLLRQSVAYSDSAIINLSAIGANYDVLSTYKNRAEVMVRLGNYKEAYEDYYKYRSINDSVFSVDNKIKLANVEAGHELQIKQKQIEINKLELANKRNERLFFTIGFLFLLIIGVLYINRQRLQQRRLEAEKKIAEHDLELAEAQLEGFRLSMQEKNSLVEQFAGEIERFKLNAKTDVDDGVLLQLQQSTILTDQQWEDFRILFERVHKGFFNRIREKMPDLTPGEIRFLALSKLKLSAKEMTNILGISLSTIRNYRLRLRRKLELDEDASLEEIADAV